MRSSILFVLALCACSIPTPTARAQERATSITWNRSYTAGLKQAQTMGKPVLLDFTASWCPPCREMEREVWPHEQVIASSERFVCVSIDVDMNAGIAMKYGAQAIPLVVLADPWGNVIGKHTGYLDVRSLVKWMNAFPSDFSQVLEWIAVADKDPGNAKALTSIGEFYRSVNAYDVSNQYYGRALKSDAAKTDLELREHVMLVVGLNHLKMGNPGEARKTFERCLRECPTGKRCDAALLGVLTSQIQQGKFAEAEKTFADLKAKFPDSPATVQAAKNLEASRASKK
jgi:thioredoxin-like negative regulator of GroEL